MSGAPATPQAETPTTPTPTTLITEPTPAVESASPPSETPEAGAPVILTPESIKLPDNVVIPDDVRDEFLGVMNNAELEPAARAQALVDLQIKLAQQASEAGSRAWEELQSTWQNEVKADPEIGGPKLDQTLLGIGRLVSEYGTPELREAFNVTGAGNNPHIIRFLSKISSVLSEGRPVSGAPPATPKTLADKLYGG